jgi:hypothetical protein
MLALGCAVVALGAPAATSAQAPSLRIGYGVAGDGGGTLRADLPGLFVAAPISWKKCDGGGTDCVPYPSTQSNFDQVIVGDSPPGTVFEASATVDGQAVSARSRPYLGPVRWTDPPGIKGSFRVNGFVRPVLARWAGGWGVERSYPQLQVCRGPRARRCLTISDAFHWNRCPGVGAVIAKRYAGWYLRAVDRRGGQAVPQTLLLHRMPETVLPVLQGGPTVSLTPGVRIAPSTKPPRRRCGRGKRLTREQVRERLRFNAEIERSRKRSAP